MELSALSSMPRRPCLLMKCQKATLLLDAAVNLESLSVFHPQTVTGKYKSRTPMSPNLPSRKVTLERFVDAVPEIQTVSFRDVEVEDIDAILISNWASLFALPFITERNEFYGAVYCTVPTKELGGLVMQEFLEFVSHIKADPLSAETKESKFTKFYSKFPGFDASTWAKVFTKEEIEKCLSRITPISFGETKLVNGIVKCTAYSSGYSIGACNWIIEIESTKFGYVSASTIASTHMRPSEWAPFYNLDYLALTSLTFTPDPNPYNMCNCIKSTMAEALKKGGNVLFPTNPVGYLFDLLEVVFVAIEEYQIPRDIPVYFVSPYAASTVAFINIFTEWLKKEKAAKVNSTEEPFVFGELMRENRIKIYDSVSGAFSKECKTPCIVFTGHPSLHIGNVVNFLELWGQDKKSVIISTDPDYPFKQMYRPFRDLQIRAYDFPIETRLDMRFVNEKLLPELLKPKTLIVPKEYVAKAGIKTEQMLISYNNIATVSYGDKPQSFKIASRKRALVQNDLLKTLNMEPKRAKMVSTCPFRGFLSTYDNDFELLSSAKPDLWKRVPALPSQKHVGVLTPENLIKALNDRGVKAEYGAATAGECLTVKIPLLKAEVRIESGGLKTRICCNLAENRRKIQRILIGCLKEL